MAHPQKLLANYSFLVGGDLAAKLLSLLAMIRMARVLGTGLFGENAFAAAFISYFLLLVSQGLDAYGVQEVARNPSVLRTHAGSILGLRLVSSGAAFALLSLIVFFLREPWDIRALLLLYGLTLFSSACSLQWVFIATEQMKFVAATSVVAQLVFSVCVLVFLRRSSQLLWIPVFQFGGEVASCAFLYLLYRRTFGSLCPTFQVNTWLPILRYSVAIGLTGAVSMVLFNFDIVMLGFMAPAAEVGKYGAAYKIIAFLSAFITLYNTNLLPTISRTRGAREPLRRVSDASLRLTAILSIPLAVGGMELAAPMMTLLFGAQYSAGAQALQILIWILPVMAIRSVFRLTLVSHGFQTHHLWISATAAVLNVALNLALIPHYGFMGAAVASLAAELVLLVLAYDQVARLVARLPVLGHVWRPALACTSIFLFLRWTPNESLFLRILGGFIVYALLAWALRAFSLREIPELWGMSSSFKPRSHGAHGGSTEKSP